MKPASQTKTENQDSIVALYGDVKNYFAKFCPPGTNIVFGWKERWKQINEGTNGANRVVMLPGDENGQDGPLEGANGPGEGIVADGTIANVQGANVIVQPTQVSVAARTIFVGQDYVTFSIWAAEQTTADEIAQQQVIRQLYEYVLRACKNSTIGEGNLVWIKRGFNINQNERRFGVEYVAVAQLETPYLDAMSTVVFPTNPSAQRGATH